MVSHVSTIRTGLIVGLPLFSLNTFEKEQEDVKASLFPNVCKPKPGPGAATLLIRLIAWPFIMKTRFLLVAIDWLR